MSKARDLIEQIVNEAGKSRSWALQQAKEAGQEARDQGGNLKNLDSLWDQELSDGDWEDILSVISKDMAKEAYAKGLAGK